jgi:predicted metal-binding transcription factor (methanogenesis marker protein 9)
VVADELLFFHPGCWRVLVPVMNNGATFMMISSIAGDPDAPMMQVLRSKYRDGTPAVKVLNWIESCKECERKGQAEMCPHRQQAPQHFGSYHGDERAEALMSIDREAYLAENKNVMSKPLMEAAFRSEWIDAMLSGEAEYSSERAIHQLYVTVDPSAAKDRNLYVLVSFIFVDGRLVVCSKHELLAPARDAALRRQRQRDLARQERVDHRLRLRQEAVRAPQRQRSAVQRVARQHRVARQAEAAQARVAHQCDQEAAAQQRAVVVARARVARVARLLRVAHHVAVEAQQRDGLVGARLHLERVDALLCLLELVRSRAVSQHGQRQARKVQQARVRPAHERHREHVGGVGQQAQRGRGRGDDALRCWRAAHFLLRRRLLLLLDHLTL